jgi:glycerophosphoryl diester phosphodiesterase
MSAYSQSLVTAHSGCEQTIPNTIDSVLAGIASGADVVEIDIQTSADGKPVLSHDPFMTTESQQHLVISEYTYGELDTLAGPLVSFTEVLHLIKERNSILNVDLKDVHSIVAIHDAIRSCDVYDSVVFSGCQQNWAQLIATTYPELQVLLNVYYDAEQLSDTDQYGRFVREICADARKTGTCGINIDYTMCRPELVSYARKRFIPVSVWTVDSDADMEKMLSLGVFAITTYYPRRLIQLRDQRPAVGVNKVSNWR